jgi:hypothetical protein
MEELGYIFKLLIDKIKEHEKKIEELTKESNKWQELYLKLENEYLSNTKVID